jgi:hypothetical protein
MVFVVIAARSAHWRRAACSCRFFEQFPHLSVRDRRRVRRQVNTQTPSTCRTPSPAIRQTNQLETAAPARASIGVGCRECIISMVMVVLIFNTLFLILHHIKNMMRIDRSVRIDADLQWHATREAGPTGPRTVRSHQ